MCKVLDHTRPAVKCEKMKTDFNEPFDARACIVPIFNHSEVELAFREALFLVDKLNYLTLTFGGIVFNGLFEGRYVAEGAEEQDHFLLFVSYRSNLHKKPNRCPCEYKKNIYLTAAFAYLHRELHIQQKS